MWSGAAASNRGLLSDERLFHVRCFAESLLLHLHLTLNQFSQNVHSFERKSSVIGDRVEASVASRGALSPELPLDHSLSDSLPSLSAMGFCRSLHTPKSVNPAQPSISDDDYNDGLTRISVMSYNVFFHPRQGQDRAARREHLIDALKCYEETFKRPLPDVVAFQEVDDAFVDDEGLKELFPYRTKRVLMNMIAAKHPISEFRHLSDQPGNMFVTLDLTERGGERTKRVHLLNVHLHAGDWKSGQEQRLREYGELKRWISAMPIPAHEPVIIAGDFNDETDDLRHMTDWVGW